MGKILAVCMSRKKGTAKKNIKKGILKKDYGLLGDAHAGRGIRQISLLAKESLDEIKKMGIKIGCGGFGENLTTLDIELTSLVVGTRLRVKDTILEISQIGKVCKRPCKIYKKQGMCILPSQGIFAIVLKGGKVEKGDKIEIVKDKRICAGVLIISDRRSRGKLKDESKELIAKSLKKLDARIVRYRIIPDDCKLISSVLKDWSDAGKLDIIITSGGTGFSPRDVTPEATKRILEKEAPGIGEMMRMRTAQKTERAYLSRGVAGIRKKTLIINLPGSPKGVKECLYAISSVLGHAIEVMRGEVSSC